MLRTHKTASLSLSALLVAGLAVAANANVTVTQTATVPLTPTNVSDFMNFAKFDVTLGTLNSITLNLTGNAFSTATVTSITNPGSTTYEFDSSSTTRLQRPGGLTTLITVLPFNPETVNLGGVGDPALPYHFADNTATDSLGSVLTAGSDLTLFSGVGTIALPFKVQGSSGVNGPGTISSTVSTQGGGVGTLFYSYTPFSTATPEPGTWAMLVAGASSGLVVVRRRRRSKK
jgi:hypothetical protein